MILKKVGQFLKLSLIGLLIVVIFNFVTLAPSYQPQETNIIRGVWLTHVGNSFLTYTSRIDNVFHDLAKLNFNRVYISVYNDGLIYKSKYGHKNKLVSLPFTDPLNSAIQQGKRQGLKIYAWYEYGMMISQGEKLAQEHPDWLLTTKDGTQVINHKLWLNPSHPEVEQYWIDLLTEAAQKYPELYGIQLDDHWGIPQAFGNKYQEMTSLTKKVVKAVREINQNLVISISPNPYNFALKNYNQDWITWTQEKLADEIVMQIYRPTSQAVATSIINSGINIAKKANIPIGIGIYTGSPSKTKSLTEISQQLSVVKKFNYGYALFCWEYLFTPIHSSSQEQRNKVFKMVNS